MRIGQELSPRALETLSDLGGFSPTVNVQDKLMKGYMLDSEADMCKTYWGPSDMRRIAADLIEAADWLETRAATAPRQKDATP